MEPYDSAFYAEHEAGSRRSADVVTGIIMEGLAPRNVVDAGCGTGEWLASFRERRVDDVLGLDGPWAAATGLKIPKDRFRAVSLPDGMDVGRRFDLAMSVEAAEHLPAEHAAAFVQRLCALSEVVMFSAAIPFQGGTRHINEQWPDYWAALFATHGYLAVDCLRPLLWRDERVEWWYAQNLLVFARRETIDARPFLKSAAGRPVERLVHPRNYLEKLEQLKPERQPLRKLLPALPAALANAVRRRLK
jgi:SAM-dependent methyltransferase